MAKNCPSREDSNSEQEEEEEEALSLCDLPLTLVKEGSRQLMREAHIETQQDSDFDFGSSSLLSAASSLSSSEADMCAADDVFFRGQILPLRRLSSVNSDGTRIHFRTLSGSESMDRGSLSLNSWGGFTSSRNSSSSSSCSSTRSGISSNTSSAVPEPRIRNPFHSHPSPKPQIRIPTGRAKNSSIRSRKSTVWDVFRLGLMRTPEMEFQDLKLRTNNNSRNSSKSSLGSRNSSTNSSSSSSNNSNYKKAISKTSGDDVNCSSSRRRRKSFDYGFLSGCKCTISEVENPSKKISTKGSTNRKKEDEEEDEKKGGKESMSRHRTFEWLKGISHGAGAGAGAGAVIE